ncbi:MAG: S1 RNA-binding domain-containing protein [bacterium]|nr:S1 RNA-binding domain-containing protein [bacterium]
MTKYKKGSIIEGSVTGIENYGVFVNLDDYYSGLIHISEISHGFVKDVNSYVNLGDTIRVKVVEVDDNSCHVKLSIKDIDYRKTKPKRKKIEEVGSGFGILGDNLDDWINSKIEEYKVENNKKN